MKSIRYGVVAITALLLSNPLHASDEDVIVTVNNSPVTIQQLSQYTQIRQGQTQGKELPQQMILDEMINRELITQDALKRNLNKDKQFTDALKEQTTNLLAAYTIQKMIQDKGEINDSVLRAEYENYVATISDLEYKASHILLDDQATATDVIADLDQGENFAKLAEAKSTGPSGPEGGSLGWFRAEQMVPEFSEALVNLKPGQHSSQPVKTRFGWHIILLEEIRSLPAPSFESMKEKLQGDLINQHVQNYIKSLRNDAKIVMKGQ